MKGFYVVYARRSLYVVFLLGIIGLSFWWSFYRPETIPTVNVSDSTSNAATLEDDEQVVQVLAGGVQRVVSELDEATVVSVTPIPTQFSEYRLERSRARSRELELLEKMTIDPTLTVTKREQANDELLKLMANMTHETEIENLLKTNGYIDAVVLVDHDSATVVVPVTLTQLEAVKIGEIINRITSVRLDRITIVDQLSKREPTSLYQS